MDKKQKYLVTGLLWSIGEDRYIQPGETVELTKQDSKILLEKNVIKPIENKEVKNDTNNRTDERNSDKG